MDPSLRGFGVAYRLTNGGVWATCITTPKGVRGMDRILHIEKVVAGLLDRYPPTLVAYEDYSYGAGPKSSNNIINLGELGGVIKRLLYTRGIAILAVPPTSLKMFATGSGRADKDAVGSFIQRTEGVTFATSDQYDAAALLKLGEAYLNARLQPRDRRHYQRRAIAGCSMMF